MAKVLYTPSLALNVGKIIFSFCSVCIKHQNANELCYMYYVSIQLKILFSDTKSFLCMCV